MIQGVVASLLAAMLCTGWLVKRSGLYGLVAVSAGALALGSSLLALIFVCRDERPSVRVMVGSAISTLGWLLLSVGYALQWLF